MNKLQSRSRAASISLRQLKFFESVGRVESVRKASVECSLSQPAVTQALAKLEYQIGTKLFERRSMGTYLNKMGRILYRRAVRFFGQLESAIAAVGAPGGAAMAPIIAKRFSRSHIDCLVSIVDCGCFDRAAERLAITDSSLQRIARTIERNLGKAIFCSTAAGKMVTPEGEKLGHEMKLALQEIDWGVQEIDAALGKTTTSVVIGAMPFGGSVLLASVLEDFVSAHPGTEVKIVNDNAAELLNSLRTGNVELVVGLVQETPSAEFDVRTLAKTPYAVVARLGHPLLRHEKVSVADLLQHPWVIGTPGSSRRACFDRLFSAGRGPQASIATCNLPVIHHLVKCSDRLTLMTTYELMNDADSLVSLPFGDIEPVPSMGITTRTNWLPTRLHRDFIELLQQRMLDTSMPATGTRTKRFAAAI